MTKPSCHPTHRKRGNITIVVLLLMIASGLLALLTLQFVKHFLTSSNVLNDYYRAYYMARGGVETMLTEANVRGYGFQYDLSQSPTLQHTFYDDCSSKGLCSFEGRIVSQGKSISNNVDSLVHDTCDPADMITLAPGASSAFPLFYDVGPGQGVGFTPVDPTADYGKLSASRGFSVTLSGGGLQAYLYDAGQGTFGQIVATESLQPPGVTTLFNTKTFSNTYWLIINNPNTNTSAAAYCITSDDAALLVGNFTRITSQATYDDKTVGITAIKKFVFPSAFIQ